MCCYLHINCTAGHHLVGTIGVCGLESILDVVKIALERVCGAAEEMSEGRQGCIPPTRLDYGGNEIERAGTAVDDGDRGLGCHALGLDYSLERCGFGFARFLNDDDIVFAAVDNLDGLAMVRIIEAKDDQKRKYGLHHSKSRTPLYSEPAFFVRDLLLGGPMAKLSSSASLPSAATSILELEALDPPLVRPALAELAGTPDNPALLRQSLLSPLGKSMSALSFLGSLSHVYQLYI
jgi:hypothetical protein